ncbi:MAG: hypothetical protein EOP09_01935 [Proteobacteria bacterium]|nr:MAG: hypothetical protein EOP09_01935 [Pseudomonadota bacterium]
MVSSRSRRRKSAAGEILVEPSTVTENAILSSIDRERIKLAIEGLEKQTSGELVPLLVSQIESYSEIHWVSGAVGALLGALVLIADSWLQSFPLSDEWIVGVLAGCAAIGLLLSAVPALKRKLIGEERLKDRARERALAEFVAQGVLETKDRTGVLLMIAAFEHRIEIIADTGIHSRADKKVWSEITDQIRPVIQNQGIAAGFLLAIEKIGEVLKREAPLQPGDRNELSDGVRDGGRSS